MIPVPFYSSSADGNKLGNRRYVIYVPGDILKSVAHTQMPCGDRCISHVVPCCAVLCCAVRTHKQGR